MQYYFWKKQTEKNFIEITGSNVPTMKSLEHFPRNLFKDWFLKIGIHSAKEVNKKSPQHCSHLYLPYSKIYQALISFSGIMV